jgi:trk system potassium uptake protein TrkA
MRIVIAGAGRAGLSVGVHLQTAGHLVTLLDRDESVSRRAVERHGMVAMAGDATDAQLLRDAEVERADVVVAMLRRDADNLAVAHLARAAGAKRVMVRMRDSDYRRVYLDAGVDRILSEIDVFVGALATSIEHEPIRHAMVLGSGESVAFELALDPGVAVVGRTVADVAQDPTFPASCVLAGISGPGGALVAPRGGSVLAEGTSLLVVARRAELGAAVAFFTRRA